jgi:hypothetical protein
MENIRVCKIENCDLDYYARGLCRKHYRQLLGKEGGYIKDYQKRKDNPSYKKMKSESDKKYIKKLKESGLYKKKQREYYSKWILDPKNKINKLDYQKLRYKNNKDIAHIYNRQYRDKIKFEVMNHYSNGKLCCVNCGIDVYPILTIDHINNDGAKHRLEVGGGKRKASPSAMYAWLKRNNYPKGFQVLCQNCNFFKDLMNRIK